MRRPKVLILLALVALFGAAACSDDYSGPGDYGGNDDPEPTETTAPEDGEPDLADAAQLSADQAEVQVEVGELVVLSLEENQSVGDLWQFAAEPDDAVLTLVDEDYEIDDPETDGGGGTAYFVFEAVGDGGTTFVMENCFRCSSDGESSETPPDPAEIEFSVEVTA